MAISFVNVAGVANSTPGTSLTISVPSGTGNGTFMLASVVTVGSDASVGFTPPAGWTLLQSVDSGASVGALQAKVYYRIANSEPSNYTWTISGTGTQNGGSIATFTGVDAVSAVDASIKNLGTGATVSSTAVAAASPNDWIVWDFMMSSNTLSAYVTPTGYTSRWTCDGAGQANCQVATKIRSTSGTEAATSVLTDAAAGEPWAVTSVALKADAPSASSVLPGYLPNDNRRSALRRTRLPQVFCAWYMQPLTPSVLLPSVLLPCCDLPRKRARRSRQGFICVPLADSLITPPTSTGLANQFGPRISLPPQQSNDDAQWQRQSAAWIAEANQGHLNNTGSVTLSASSNTTVVVDNRAGSNSHISFTALTANAAAEVRNGTLYVSTQGKGTFTITHANNAQTDRTLSYSILG